MDNLRLILLIIGCLIVLGIYMWDIFRNNAPKKRTDILNAVDETPESPIPSVSSIASVNTNNVSADNFSNDTLADLGSLLTQSRNQNIEIEDSLKPFHIEESKEDTNNENDGPLPLEMSVKDYEASLNENTEPGIFTEIGKSENLKDEGKNIETASLIDGLEDDKQEYSSDSDEIDDYELALEPNETDIPENNKSSDDLIVLYITSPSHISFNGLSISKAADEVGMIYGHMNIFHHFGPGKLHSGQPLFSLANMHEPGSFDLGRMSDLKTKGLAVFMYSPASIDASVVFELFLNTAQRLAELLGGTVRTADNEVLNNVSIKTLREKAEALTIT